MLKRKLTAAVLALALACSILPGMAVFAEDAPGGAGAIVVQEAPVQETPAAGTPAQPDAPVVSLSLIHI